ncbi:MAG TPA: sugar nucleotide-binding protein [Azospirillaceae bacterium]|nr:sugar nucleotide-binding protein [Azospirillaceae bacterium]
MASSSSNSADALVVGGDGMVGSHLAAHLRARGLTVHATTRRPDRAGPGTPLVDLTAGGWPDLDGARYGTAFLCAAQARLAQCRADPEGSRRVNVEGAAALARLLSGRGTRVVFLSTNQVFDGSRAPRRAEEAVCPVSLYGRQKAEAEAEVLALPGAAVLRLTKIIHPGLALFEGWVRDLRAGRPIRPFTDLGLACVTVNLVSRCLESILHARDAAGIWQLSAPGDVTYADAAGYIAERLGADAALVQPAAGLAAAQMGGDPPARWTALDCRRVVAELGIRPPEALDAVASVLDIPAQDAERRCHG